MITLEMTKNSPLVRKVYEFHCLLGKNVYWNLSSSNLCQLCSWEAALWWVAVSSHMPKRLVYHMTSFSSQIFMFFPTRVRSSFSLATSKGLEFSIGEDTYCSYSYSLILARCSHERLLFWGSSALSRLESSLRERFGGQLLLLNFRSKLAGIHGQVLFLTSSVGRWDCIYSHPKLESLNRGERRLADE